MAIEDPFIGTGWRFPPGFDKQAGTANMSSGVRDIEESLEIIFTTRLGERIMRPRFGCALDDRVFDAMNSSQLAFLENQIRTAILYHEPRIDADMISIEADEHEGRLVISIAYRVRGTNSRFNFVYPYYLAEN